MSSPRSRIQQALKRSKVPLVVFTFVAVHAGLLSYSAWCHSPAWDEIGHLPAGLSHWRFGRYDLYRVNPPLVRMIAAVPLLFAHPREDWSKYSTSLDGRAEFAVGKDFLEHNVVSFQWLFTMARWACIPLAVLGAIVCWRWATDLYGASAGIVALVLWCFCPSVLAFGALITPDVGAAAIGAGAAYSFWRWLRFPSLFSTVIAGVTMGLAELTKTSWIILFGLWPALTLFWAVSRLFPEKIGWRTVAKRLAMILFLAIVVLNIGYECEGTFTRLEDYRFCSTRLRPASSGEDTTGNRFIGTWPGKIPLPLPRNYVLGIDVQKREFESNKSSYLRGQWKHGGWYYYYVYAALIKLPVGILLLAMVAATGGLASGGRAELGEGTHTTAGGKAAESGTLTRQRAWQDEVVLVVPAIAILLLVSSQNGMNRHLRYALPAFPFMFIWISRVVHCAAVSPAEKWPGDSTARPKAQHKGRRPVLKMVVAVLLSWAVASSLFVYPHCLSYFNEIVGGPANGHLYLGHSNVDWGQDLWFLRSWYDRHPEARPLHLAFGIPIFDPRIAGIECDNVPVGPVMNRAGSPTTRNWPWGQSTADAVKSNVPPADSTLAPLPGWYVMSSNVMHREEGDYEYFQEFEPVDHIGYSLTVYHLSVEEVNPVRRKLSLPPIMP
jgi:4-amino-4-deoxy-L-arabinose transferase-like glycosyltransferase